MNYDIHLSLEFMKSHPLDAARVLEKIPVHDVALFIKSVPPDIAADVIRLIDSLIIIRCFELMKPDVIGAITERLPLEIASIILRKMDTALKDSVMKTLSPKILEPLNLMLRFPEGTAGALMDPLYFVLPQDIHAKDALRRVRYHLKQNTSYIYIVDRDNVISGFINIYELLRLGLNEPISSIIHTDIWRLSAYSERQEILINPGWREFSALPVVDEKDIFLGAIDYQTIRRLEQDIINSLHQSPLKETTEAMGELFWVGLSGLVKGVASTIIRSKE